MCGGPTTARCGLLGWNPLATWMTPCRRNGSRTPNDSEGRRGKLSAPPEKRRKVVSSTWWEGRNSLWAALSNRLPDPLRSTSGVAVHNTKCQKYPCSPTPLPPLPLRLAPSPAPNSHCPLPCSLQKITQRVDWLQKDAEQVWSCANNYYSPPSTYT